MMIIRRDSPNHGPRPAGRDIDAIILHADASATAVASADWCRRPESKVSYHALVERDGSVYVLVPGARRAWHAGVSELAGVPNCNDYALGLCLSNRQDGRERFTDAQYWAGAIIASEWMRVWPRINTDRITTHAAVARPVGRKTDPGPLFDLDRFRRLVHIHRVLAASDAFGTTSLPP